MMGFNKHLVSSFSLIFLLKMGECLAGRNRRKEELMITFGKQIEALRQNQLQLMEEFSQLNQELESIKKYSSYDVPLDCNSARIRGDWRSVTLISPPGLEPREVRCDQVTSGGGWTILLRRVSKLAHARTKHRRDRKPLEKQALPSLTIEEHENFNRSWDEYRRGFGDPADEYWIGNDVIHALTNDVPWEAAVLIQRWDETREAAAFWDSFRLGGEKDKFRLEISGFQASRSEIGNGLAYHDGKFFSTEDADNDENDRHCARMYGGGFWFHQCHVVHLTGSHLEPGTEGENALHWLPHKGDKMTLKSAVLMIRPKFRR